jgi:hypothetical protein
VLEQRLEQHGGAGRVRSGVLHELVHALADADAGGEVDDRVDPVQGAPDHVGIAQVLEDELDLPG